MLNVHRTPAGSIVRDDLRAVAAVRDDIVNEFLALPGLKLTFHQARRLWNLPADRCARVLNSLVADGLLQVGPDGAYRRSRRNHVQTA